MEKDELFLKMAEIFSKFRNIKYGENINQNDIIEKLKSIDNDKCSEQEKLTKALYMLSECINKDK